MNRTGLVVALAVGAVVGVVFGIYPQLDIAISRPFHDPARNVFPIIYSLVARHLRDIFNYTTAILVAPAVIAIVLKLILPRRRMLISGRAAIFLVATIALAPGVMANVILKENWNSLAPWR